MSPSSHLDGARVLVTGASRGIGRAVVEHLASLGTTLICVARNRAELEELCSSLPGGPHLPLALDVADEAAWKGEGRAAIEAGALNGVVTAAGVIGPIGRFNSFDVEEFRRTLDVNLIGTALAISTSFEALRASAGSVVTFSGGGATAPLPRFDAYAASKAAVVRLTENLARDLSPEGIRCNSVAPGFVVTEMHRETLEAGPDRVGRAYFEKTRQALDDESGDPPELAARLCVFLLSEDSAGISGKLLSARWDPWEEREFQARLRSEPDLATLRRIDNQFFAALQRPD